MAGLTDYGGLFALCVIKHSRLCDLTDAFSVRGWVRRDVYVLYPGDGVWRLGRR